MYSTFQARELEIPLTHRLKGYVGSHVWQLLPLHSVAQAGKVTYLPQQKDIALLVGVSVSVQKNIAGHSDAKQIIKDIVGGSGVGKGGPLSEDVGDRQFGG